MVEESLVLFGHKGSGKSYWGRRLADALGWEFVDTDTLIEKECLGMSCREISLKLGQERFREIEKKVILRLQKKERVILAVGGGAVLDEEIRAHLRRLGKMVYMKVSKQILKKRLLEGEVLPSFLDPLDPEASFERMYLTRTAVYEGIEAAPWESP